MNPFALERPRTLTAALALRAQAGRNDAPFEYIAGGHLFPLDILPPVLAQALQFTPFPYQMFFPVSIYLGQTTGPAIWQGLAVQACWVAAAFGLARFVWSRGIRKYAAVGG